ncbi:MAG: HAMP domain-containing histidine kinase [Lachnospiraceae bacterium]|nr:HAMP domain-containing histidine kinase [Lachnospiraceae bacterium]
MPEIRETAAQTAVILAILLFTSGATMLLWVYRSIIAPISDLKKATQEIKEGNLDYQLPMPLEGDEIAELCEDFESMRIRLKESAEEKVRYDQESKELISNISHDLKTPVTAIKGYAEGILEGVASSPEKMEKYVRTILAKAGDMDRLIDELTFYSKIDTNRIPYNFAKISVMSYFSDCVEEVGTELETYGIELRYENDLLEDTTVIADPEQLGRVIHNIISNSIKYMDKKRGLIQIRVLDVGDFVQIEIEDNGRGIAAADLPNIFDRFYRTDASRSSSTGGSGIGLSIVKKIIEDHGGRIWATSREGLGTCMHFVLRKYQEAVIH